MAESSAGEARDVALWLEDEPSQVVAAVNRLKRDYRWRVEVVGSVDDARKVARQRSSEIGMLLVDLKVPSHPGGHADWKNGLDFLVDAKREGGLLEDVPYVVITQFQGPMNIEEYDHFTDFRGGFSKINFGTQEVDSIHTLREQIDLLIVDDTAVAGFGVPDKELRSAGWEMTPDEASLLLRLMPYSTCSVDYTRHRASSASLHWVGSDPDSGVTLPLLLWTSIRDGVGVVCEVVGHPLLTFIAANRDQRSFSSAFADCLAWLRGVVADDQEFVAEFKAALEYGVLVTSDASGEVVDE